ncbi:hypothetical protein HHX47_DHR3000644 [Lentinula edodes]|nr:hypothetical protein HHX47_DHR3000644 [Lentinula edodes]
MNVDSDSDISISDYEENEAGVSRSRTKGKKKATDKRKKDKAKRKPKDVQAYTWEANFARSWETVQEDEGGSLQGAVNDWMARGRRKRLLQPQNAIRRTIIRHMVLLIDLSSSMMDRDMRPTRFAVTLQYAREFVLEWFDQNPLGQMAVVGMRAGVGERICDMSGNPQDVLKSISDRHKLEPIGEPSLQNSIEMARNITSQPTPPAKFSSSSGL